MKKKYQRDLKNFKLKMQSASGIKPKPKADHYEKPLSKRIESLAQPLWTKSRDIIMKQVKKELETDQCTFRPKVITNPKFLSPVKNNDASVFDRMYETANLKSLYIDQLKKI